MKTPVPAAISSLFFIVLYAYIWHNYKETGIINIPNTLWYTFIVSTILAFLSVLALIAETIKNANNVDK